jgi:beta-phosphoglucomutase-like phosphatase (HAD superfamily)
VIRVVMFDLGMTLVDADRRPFPHAEDALTAVSNFKTADGKPLRSCLVSDFTMAAPPATVAKITALFKQYLAILDRTGLRRFFEPVNKRVTLSTHAGAQKPDRRIFEKALERLGADVSLEECLFITEEPTHIEKARETLKMATLQFRSAGSGQFDFDDWADAPALIANLVAPHQAVNTLAVIKAHLKAKGIDMLTAEPEDPSGRMRFSGQVWSPISVPGFEDLKDIHVAIPVEGEVTRGHKGEVRSVMPAQPSAEQVAEATSFVRSLATQGQIAGRTGKPAARATHQIETDKKGIRHLVRKRFTAL